MGKVTNGGPLQPQQFYHTHLVSHQTKQHLCCSKPRVHQGAEERDDKGYNTYHLEHL